MNVEHQISGFRAYVRARAAHRDADADDATSFCVMAPLFAGRGALFVWLSYNEFFSYCATPCVYALCICISVSTYTHYKKRESSFITEKKTYILFFRERGESHARAKNKKK